MEKAGIFNQQPWKFSRTINPRNAHNLANKRSYVIWTRIDFKEDHRIEYAKFIVLIKINEKLYKYTKKVGAQKCVAKQLRQYSSDPQFKRIVC